MARGKSFNHKLKGYEHKVPEYGKNVGGKNTEEVEFAIEPVASDGERPITQKVDKN